MNENNVPAGWCLVPVEPTFEMRKAGQEAAWDFYPGERIQQNEDAAVAAFAAMIDAAPVAPLATSEAQPASTSGYLQTVGEPDPNKLRWDEESTEFDRIADAAGCITLTGGGKVFRSDQWASFCAALAAAPVAQPPATAEAVARDDDRELLERAAGAFGVPAREEGGYMYAAPAEISTSGWGIVTWMGYGTVQFWNPLESNDDAFRLAVKLNLRVDCYDDQVETMDGCEPYKIGPETLRNTFCKVELVDSTQDRYAATRRAIVRAAAALAPKDTQ